LAYSVYSFNSSSFDSGVFGVYLGTTQDKVNQAIGVIGEEMLRITNNITDQELKRVMAQTKAGLLMAKESILSRSQKIGSDVLAFDRIVFEDEILERISAISKKDITNFASKMIGGSKLNFSAIGKIKDIDDHQTIGQKFV
jgi:predicted Zn-dependent peptidase